MAMNPSLMVEIGANVARLRSDMDKSIKEIERLRRESNRNAQDMRSTFDQSIAGISSAWVSMSVKAAAAFYTIKKAWDLAKIGADFEEQKGILDNLSAKYNLTANSIIDSMQRASTGLIAKTDLMQIALGGLSKGLRPDQLINLADAADLLGDAVGVDATTALNDLTQALETGRTKGLKNYLGTSLDLKDAFGDMAEKMNATQKAQAMYLLVMKTYAELQAQQNKAVDDGSDKLERMEARFKDIKTSVAEYSKTLVVAGVDFLHWLVTSQEVQMEMDLAARKGTYGNSNIARVTIDRSKQSASEYQKQIDNLKKELEKERKERKLGNGATKAGEPQWMTDERVAASEAYRKYMGYGMTNNIDAMRGSGLEGMMDYEAYARDAVESTTVIFQEASDQWIDLSERTADAIEQNFSDLFFDAFTGELKSLSDYANSVFRSMARMTSDIMGQMVKDFIFGGPTTGGASGLAALFSAFSGPSVMGYAEGGTINEPIFGIGKSGQRYTFGENGPETIIPNGKKSSGGSIKQNLQVTIVAADSKSFVDMANRNPEAVIGPFISALNKGNQGVISALRRVQ